MSNNTISGSIERPQSNVIRCEFHDETMHISFVGVVATSLPSFFGAQGVTLSYTSTDTFTGQRVFSGEIVGNEISLCFPADMGMPPSTVSGRLNQQVDSPITVGGIGCFCVHFVPRSDKSV